MRALACLGMAVLALYVATPAHASLTRVSTPIGPFALIEETKTLDPDEPLIMHVASTWTKLELRWPTPDGLSISLKDDGQFLDLVIDNPGCLSLGITSYANGARGVMRDLRIARRNRVAVCRRLGAAKLSAEQAALEVNGSEFESAFAALKARATTAFHSLKRCTPPKQRDFETASAYDFPQRPCGTPR